MTKTRQSKRQSKRKQKSVLNGTRAVQKEKMTEDPSVLFEQAIVLLQTGQPAEALVLVERGLRAAPTASPNTLIGLNLIGEIYVELGDIDSAREHFMRVCGVIEIYMTDLSWEEDAESRCEALITEALLMAPESSECLQTLASVRISQLRYEDARAALSRSLALWKDLPPDSPHVPDFPVRISLSRLLMEAEMESEALVVLERMILEDDQSVETWYLGGWCQYLLGKKAEEVSSGLVSEAAAEQQRSLLLSSRGWLKQSLKLYDMIQYEDLRLRDHAVELVQVLEKELGEFIEDSGDEGAASNEDEWEDEIEGESDYDDDHEMKDP